MVVIQIRDDGNADLLGVADAVGALGHFPRIVQCRQQHRRQYCDDRNNDEQLDQGEKRRVSGTAERTDRETVLVHHDFSLFCFDGLDKTVSTVKAFED